MFPDSPLTFGAPNGIVTHVQVLIGFAGLQLGEAWVTGADVPDWIAKNFLRAL
jgi:hypothetical protein